MKLTKIAFLIATICSIGCTKEIKNIPDVEKGERVYYDKFIKPKIDTIIKSKSNGTEY